MILDIIFRSIIFKEIIEMYVLDIIKEKIMEIIIEKVIRIIIEIIIGIIIEIIIGGNIGGIIGSFDIFKKKFFDLIEGFVFIFIVII